MRIVSWNLGHAFSFKKTHDRPGTISPRSIPTSHCCRRSIPLRGHGNAGRSKLGRIAAGALPSPQPIDSTSQPSRSTARIHGAIRT